MKSQLKKTLTKNNFLVFGGGLVLTLILLLPQRQNLTCPQGKTADSIIGGSCSQFTDQDSNGLCDFLQEAALSPQEFDFSYFREFVVFGFLLITAAALNFKQPRNLAAVRLGFLTFSLVFFGFFLNQSLCPIATLQMIPVLKDQLVLSLFIFLVFLLPVLTTLLWGKIFCHFLCPLGAGQELVFRLPRKFLKIPVFTKIPRFLFSLPNLVLVASLLGSAYLSQAVFCRLDPFGWLFSCNPGSGKIIALAVFLFSSLFVFRPFCHFLCPLGAVFKSLSQFQIFRKEAGGKRRLTTLPHQKNLKPAQTK